ncbi:MAG: NUMOD4 domain-containing protein, partial [Candidatus Dojkabacteria bacterium]
MATNTPAKRGRPPKPKEVEAWKDIAGYEGHYQISSFGRVKSLERTLPHSTFGSWTISE